MEYKKITVLIVTYKQAEVIGRNLDSILKQKDYGLHEIVVCDDCSPDNNWEVIQEYVKKYPSIIRAYRNDKNLGIYGNSSKLVTLRGQADLYCWIEGDDAMCDGFLKNIQNKIKEEDIDLADSIGIWGDWKMVDPDGNEHVFSNSLVIKSSYSPLSLYIRGILSWRGSMFSEKVLASFRPVILDRGLNLAESLFDSQYFRYVSRSYYLNSCCTIYYTNIGISTELVDTSYYKEENIIKWEYLRDQILKHNTDISFANANIHRSKFLLNNNAIDFLKAIYFLLSSGFPNGWRTVHDIKTFVSVMVRSLFKCITL